MALARRGRAAVGEPDVWEVDRCNRQLAYHSGLLVQQGEGGGWEIKLYLRPVGFHRAWVEYAARHALLETRFSSRARAVDAIRIALACEPLSRPRPRTTWQRESEGVYRSRNRRWRLERTPSLTRLIPFSREAGGQVEGFPQIRRLLERRPLWTLACCGEWADRIESHLLSSESKKSPPSRLSHETGERSGEEDARACP